MYKSPSCLSKRSCCSGVKDTFNYDFVSCLYFSYYSDRVEERIINLSHTEVDRDFSKYNTVENIQWCIQNLNMKGIEDYEFDVLGYHSDAIDLRIHTDLLVKMIVPDAIDTIFTDQIIDLEKLVWITDVSDMRVFAQDI